MREREREVEGTYLALQDPVNLVLQPIRTRPRPSRDLCLVPDGTPRRTQGRRITVPIMTEARGIRRRRCGARGRWRRDRSVEAGARVAVVGWGAHVGHAQCVCAARD